MSASNPPCIVRFTNFIHLWGGYIEHRGGIDLFSKRAQVQFSAFPKFNLGVTEIYQWRWLWEKLVNVNRTHLVLQKNFIHVGRKVVDDHLLKSQM